MTELPGQILAAADWLAQKSSSICRFVAAEVAAVEIAVAVTTAPVPRPGSESEPGFAEVAAVEIAFAGPAAAAASSVRWRQSPPTGLVKAPI